MTETKTLLAFAAPYRRALAAGVLLMLGESGAALAVPWLGGRLAGTLLHDGAGGTAENVQPLLGGMLALFAVQALLKFGNAYLLGGTAERIVADLKIRLYDHLQALPLAFFHQRRQGETLALLTQDTYVVSGYVSGTALAVAPLLFTLTGALLLMFRADPLLALLAAILIPLFYLLVKILGRRLRPLARQLQEEHAAGIAIAEENLGMLPAIKTFTLERQESLRYRRQIERIVQLSAQERRVYAALGPSVQLIAAAAIVLVLWLAQGELGDGTLTVSGLVSFLLYGQLMTRPVAVADVYGQTQQMRGALARLLEVLAEMPEPPWQVGKPLPKLRGEIEFDGVSFAYPGRPPVLRQMHLRIAAGETVALTGPNGAGKSTLAHLLTRLIAPSEGSIRIDGTDIATASLPSLRGQIGVVPQHVLLFNATVRDNIAYGRPEPAQEDVEAAARGARAHDFILRLPQGYDTFIGDRGVRLSGGQQQRLALARALLKDPPILILDEATAMFDPEGERDFISECHDLLKTRTVILITHRPASLALADRVLRLEQGQLRQAAQPTF